jgi:hypothetical protein
VHGLPGDPEQRSDLGPAQPLVARPSNCDLLASSQLPFGFRHGRKLRHDAAVTIVRIY